MLQRNLYILFKILFATIISIISWNEMEVYPFYLSYFEWCPLQDLIFEWTVFFSLQHKKVLKNIIFKCVKYLEQWIVALPDNTSNKISDKQNLKCCVFYAKNLQKMWKNWNAQIKRIIMPCAQNGESAADKNNRRWLLSTFSSSLAAVNTGMFALWRVSIAFDTKATAIYVVH